MPKHEGSHFPPRWGLIVRPRRGMYGFPARYHCWRLFRLFSVNRNRRNVHSPRRLGATWSPKG